MFEYHPISARDQSRLHQFGKQVLPGIFLGCALIAEGIRKGDFLIADLEELEKWDASEIYPRRINAKEVFISQKGEEFIFPVAGGKAKLSGSDDEFREATLRREQTKGAKISVEDFKANRESLNRQNQKGDAEARADFWSIQRWLPLSSSR